MKKPLYLVLASFRNDDVPVSLHDKREDAEAEAAGLRWDSPALETALGVVGRGFLTTFVGASVVTFEAGRPTNISFGVDPT